MQRPHEVHLVPTTESLTITIRVAAGGTVRGDHYRIPLRDLRTGDVEALVVALGEEANRRVRDRWAQLQDKLPF